MDDPATGWHAPGRTLDRVGTVETRGTTGPATSTASSSKAAAWSRPTTVRQRLRGAGADAAPDSGTPLGMNVLVSPR